MRGYMELLDFLRALSDGLLDHLPKEQRVGQLTVEDVIARWMEKKSYLAALSLRKDIVTYAKLHESGDYSVDQLLSDYDLDFVIDRFGCYEHVFLTGILGSIDRHLEEKKKNLRKKILGCLGFK